MLPKDADGMANSVDPDQTAPLGAVWSWSALFAQTYLLSVLVLRIFMVLTVQGGCIHGSPSICMGNRFLVLKLQGI